MVAGLRLMCLLVVVVGVWVNWREVVCSCRIQNNLLAAKVNGLKHQSAANLVTSAWLRLVAQICLAVLVLVMFLLPPLAADCRREATDLVIVARTAFIALSLTITAAGFGARQGRIKTVRLIEAEDGH